MENEKEIKEEPKPISAELDSMISALNGSNEDVKEETKEEKVEERVLDVSTTDKKESEEHKEATSSTEIGSAKEEVKADDRDQVIADLRAKLAEKVAAEVKPAEKAAVKDAVGEILDQDFIGDLDLDDLTRDSKEFNKLLNKIYRKAVSDASNSVSENTLKSIPDIVKTNLTMMQDLQKMSDEFYTENSDLKPFKKVVATVFEEMAAANPDKKYSEVVKDVAAESRKRLELHKTATSKDTTKPSSPRLPSKGGRPGRSEQPETSSLQNELSEMNKSLGA